MRLALPVPHIILYRPGNVALAGHRDSFFRGLERVRKKDVIEVTTPEGAFDYRVESISVVPPSRADLLLPTRSPMLTLVTCYPFAYIGPAPDRYIVRARQISPAARREAARPYAAGPMF